MALMTSNLDCMVGVVVALDAADGLDGAVRGISSVEGKRRLAC